MFDPPFHATDPMAAPDRRESVLRLVEAFTPEPRRLPGQPSEAMLRSKGVLTARYEARDFRQDDGLVFHAINGWLDPEGKLYPCPPKQHDPLIVYLGFRFEYEAEDAGWCKLSNLRWLLGRRHGNRGLTTPQKRTLEQWHWTNGFPMPDWE